MCFLHNHVHNKFDPNDWPPGPVVDQARLASPFRSSQGGTGRLVHVVLVIFAEYHMKRLQRGKCKLCHRGWIYTTVGNERTRTGSTYLAMPQRWRGLPE
jgi:hypothetical protein